MRSASNLKVYEVKKSGDHCFRIQTSSSASAVGTFVKTCPEDDATRGGIAHLKTGDAMSVKGVIDGVSFRKVQLEPAIVTLGRSAGPTPDAAPPSPVAAAAPAGAAAQVATSPEGAALFTIAKLKPEARKSLDGKGFYVRTEFSATATQKPEKGTAVVVKFACKVGSELVVDKSHTMERWDELDAKQTKKASASAWAREPLDQKPASCTFTFGSGRLFGEPTWNLGTFCFTPPSTVADGPCAP